MNIKELSSMLVDESVGGLVCKKGNIVSFSLCKIRNMTRFIMEHRFVNDLVIIPYHVMDGKIMELYEFTLSIRVLEKLQGKEKFFLAEAGVKCVEEITPSFLHLMDNTYYEVLIGDVESFVNCLERYFDFMEKIEKEILESETPVTQGKDLENGIFYELF